MKTTIVFFALIGLLLAVKTINANQFTQNSCFENISNQTFKTKMSESQDIVVIDVRTEDEYSASKIGDALNIDVLKSSFKSKAKKLDKSKTYLVYCRSGVRSSKASEILCNLGFEKVYNLSTGYAGWK